VNDATDFELPKAAMTTVTQFIQMISSACPTASRRFAGGRQVHECERTVACVAQRGIQLNPVSHGTCAAGTEMSGITSVVIVWVAGAPAKTRYMSRPSAFPSMDSGTVVAIVSVPTRTEAVPTGV
jgi:hypothetical protein